jgi:predicted nuclease of predicted toxin-antitoxin system
VKLLFDENLSLKLVRVFAKDFPGSSHVEVAGLRGATDSVIWDYARDNGFTIISKDNDFRQRSFLHGAPPKVIWLSIGNAGTDAIASLLRNSRDRVYRFIEQPDEGLLVLQGPTADGA